MSRTRNFGSGIFGFLAILVCFAFSLTACQVGLGAAVDTSDPRVGVIIPNSGSALGGSTIHIAGTCEDDTGIAEVQIVQLVNRDTGREYNDLGNASLSDNGRAWSIDLTRVGSSTSTYMLNGRELYLPDGGYQITVLPVDIGGRTPKYGVDRTFDIDNTPPFFLISSPNSTNIADPSPYGTTVKIKGTVYDKHEVRDINAFVYTPSGAPVALQKTGDMEAVLSKDKSSFEVILAKQNSTADAKASGNYGVLYPGSSDGKYYMEVELEDSVNVGTDLPGNKSSMVYFRANLFNILKKELGVTTINAEDLITGYNGTNPNLSSEQCEKLKKIMDGTYSLENDNSYTASEKIYYAKASTTNDGRLAFLVNPNNTPKYSFGGMAYTDSNPQGGKAAAGGSISLSVTSSSDEYMIRPDSIVVKLTAVDESGTPITPPTVYYSGSGSSDGFSVTTDGINGLGSAGIDAATYIVTLPDNLTETYYKLELSQGYGYNLEHSDDPTYNVNLSATNTDGYGFMVYSNKIPVTISTNDDATYVAKDGSNQYQLTVTVSDPNDTPTIKTANGSIKYQMQTIQGYRSKDQLTWPEPTNSNTETIPGTSGAITGSGPDYSLTLSGLGFNVNNDTVGTIAIRIWGDNGTESEKKVFVRYVDNKVPTLTVHNDDELRNAGTTFIREINPNYSAIEGKYTISGTWKDTDGSGVQSLQYTTAASPTDGDWINIVTPYTNRIINELSWSIQIPVSDGTMSSLKIRAKDLVGNENVKTYTGIKFDFGDPVFSNVPALTKANYINKTGTTFTPKATDGFGLLSLNVTAKLNGTTVQPSNNGYTLTVTDTDDKSKTATIVMGPTDNSDGEWEIELTATDLNERTTPAKFGFMFDHTAPVINDGTTIGDGAYSVTAWQKDRSARISGTIKESVSLKNVYYLVKKSGDALPDPTPADVSAMSGAQSIAFTNSKGMSVPFSITVDGLTNNESHGNVVYIQAEDDAGNKGEVKSFVINVDQSEPELKALRYKIRNGEEGNASGTVAVNSESLTLYGTYRDPASGVKPLGFEIGSTSVNPEISYTTAVLSGTDDAKAAALMGLSDSAWKTYSTDLQMSTDEKVITGWKAVIDSGAFRDGTVKINGEDKAGNTVSYSSITLKKDTTKPTVSNVSIEGENVYRQNDTTYWVKKVDDQTTQIAVKGVSADDYALKDTFITIEGLAPITRTGASWTTGSTDISGLTGNSVTITVVSRDSAGNESNPTSITLNFDKVAPSRKKADDVGYPGWGTENNWKDTEFKIGGGNYNAESYSGSTSLQISGSFDEDGSGISAVYYELVNGTTALSLNGSNYATKGTLIVPNADGSFGVTLSGLQEGSNKLRVIAVDNVGNWSKITDATDKYESDFILGLDQTAPAFGNGFALDGSDEYVTGTSDFTISGGTVSDDRAGVDPSTIQFWFVNKNNPSTKYTIKRTAGTYGQLTYTQTDPTDSNLSGDVSITVTPGTWFTEANLGTSPILYGSMLDYSNPQNNSGTVTILTTIKLDQTAPAIAIDSNLNTTPITDENDGGKIKKVGDNYFYELTGTWSDANGSGTDKLFYSINNGTDWIDADSLATKNYAKSKAESSWSLNIPVVEGSSYTFAVKAKDAAGNEKEAKPNKTVTFDFSKPTITVDKDSGIYGGTRPQATITANDHYQISGITVVSATKNGSAAVQGTDYVLSNIAGGGTASATRVVTIQTDGVFAFTFKSTDVNNRSSDTVSRTWTVDTQAPVAKADNDASYGLKVNGAAAKTWYRDTNLRFDGYVTEEISGLSKVYYLVSASDTADDADVLAGSQWNFAGSSNTGTVAYSVTPTVGDGTSYVHMIFEDAAGNQSEVKTSTVKLDQDVPTISGKFYTYNGVTAEMPSSLFVNTGKSDTLTLYGLVNETGSGIDTLTLTKSGDTFSPTITYATGLTGTSAANEFTGATWSGTKTGTTAWKATFNVNGLSTGPIQAAVSDLAGNGSTVQLVSLDSDATAPTLTLTNSDLQTAPYGISERSPYMTVDGGHHNYTFQGSWSDAGSGTYALYYSTNSSTIGSGTWIPVDSTSAPQSTGTTNWTLTLDLEEGTGKQIAFYAEDKVGNKSSVISKTGITVDYTDPTLTLSPATAETYYPLESTNTAIWTITASDNLGTPSVTVVARKDGSVVSSGTNGYTYNASSKTITLANNANANGTWNITVTATDGAERTSVETLNTIVDRSKPTFNNDIEIHDGDVVKTYDESSWSRNGTLTVKGTINEAGSGLSIVYFMKGVAAGVDNLKEITSEDRKSVGVLGIGSSVEYEFTVSDLAAGSTVVGIQTEDKAGNLSDIKRITLNLDKTNPSFGSTNDRYYSFAQAADYKLMEGTILSNGTKDIYFVGPYSDAGSGVAELAFETVRDASSSATNCTVEYSTDTIASGATNIGSMSWKTYAQIADKTTIKSYRAKIGKDDFENGDSIVAKPLDRAGNGSTQPIFTIAIDSTAPVITLNTPKTKRLLPTADAESVNTVNGTITFAGTTDETSMDKLELYRGTAQNACNTKLTEKLGAQAYNWSFDVPLSTVDSGTVKFIDETNYAGSTKDIFLKLVATDKAGNVASYVYQYTVDPDKDRPIITFPQLDLSGLTESSSVSLTTDRTLTGSVTDDDGVSKLEYQIGSGDWAELTVTNGNFSYTFTDETNYAMKFRVTDAAGTEFETKLSPAAQYLAPKFVDKNTTASTCSVLNVLMDVTAPVVSGKFYTYSGVTDAMPGNLFVNTSESKTLTLYGLVTETGSGIDTLSLTKAGDSFSPTIAYATGLTGSSAANDFTGATWGSAKTGATAWRATFNVSGLSNGAIQATVSDVAGNSGSAQIVTLYSDATVPTLTLSNSDLETAPYSITERSPYMNVDGEHHNYTFQGTWSDTGSGTYKLYYSTTTSTFNASTWEEVPTSSAPQATGTTNWTLTLDLEEGNNKQINFCAVDKVGNQSAIISKTGIIIDYTDPTLTLTPATAEAYYGEETTNTAVWTVAASDNIGTPSVTVVAKKDGTEVSSGTNGYTYSSNTITLGTTDAANGTWNITVTATDSAGRKTVKTLSTIVDRTKPVITDTLSIRDGGEPTPYSIDSWSKNGTLTLLGKITETGSGLKTLYYKKGISENATVVKGSQDNSVTLTGKGDDLDYEVSITGFGTGSTRVGLQTEDAAGNLSDVKFFMINVDKRAPTFNYHYYSYNEDANYTETGGTVLSNGENDLYLVGSYSDADSGIDQLKFEINETELTSTECTLEYSTDTIASGATNIGSMTWESYNQSNAGNYKSYRAKIVKNKFSSAGGVVDAKPIDRAGNGSTQTIFTIAIDNTAPVLTLNTPKTQRLAPTTDNEQVNTVNGTITFAGTTEETSMNSLKLYWGTSQDTCTAPVENGERTAAQSYNWSFNVPISYVDSGTVKFIDGTNYTGSTKTIFLKLVALDKAGNSVDYIYKYTVDPDKDRPIITFTQLDLSGLTESTATSNVWLKDNQTMTGSVTDDDGVTKLESRQKTYNSSTGTWSSWSDWTNRSITNGNFTIPFEQETKYSLEFRVTDGAGTEFTTVVGGNQYLAPKFVDQNGADSNYSVLNLAVDITSPNISEVKYIANDGSTDRAASTDFTAKYFGGKWKKFKLLFDASDNNGIKTAKVIFNGKEYTATNTSGNTYSTGYIPLDYVDNGSGDPLPSGNYTATIIATDNADREGRDSMKASFVVDNDAPTVRITQPNSLVSMAALAQGSLSEVNGLANVYYMVTEHGVDPETIDAIASGDQDGTNRWKEYTKDNDSISTFDITFDNAQAVNHSSLLKWYLASLGIATVDEINGANGSPRYTTLTVVDLHVKAVDYYGNVGYATKSVTVDPQGDKPTVTITYPVTGSTLGGAIPIMGTAIDNVSADNVMVMIDMDNDGDWDKDDIDALGALDPVPSWLTWGKFDGTPTATWTEITYDQIPENASDWTKYGIKQVVNNASWNFTVNQSGELNPTSSGTRNLAVWVYATDGEGNSSQIDLTDHDKTPYVSFTIDKDTPQIANEYLVQYDNHGNITAKYAYSKDMSIKGEWFYEADMYDDSGIQEVMRVTLVDGSEVPSSTISMTAAGTDPSGNITLSPYSNTGISGFHIKMKVGSSTDNEVVYQNWKLYYDETGGQHTGMREVALNVDNKAPVTVKTGDYYNINERVTNENGFYTFGAQAKEDPSASGVSQTGVERIAFYFTRDIDSASIHSLYDVMIANGATGNAISGYTSSLTYEDGLYWKTLTGTASGKTFTLTSADLNVHTGGLVKINGVIYRIERVSGKTVTIEVNTTATEPFAGVGSAMFAMANVVDNTTEETADENSSKTAGYYTNVNFDDGDLMVESLKKQSTTWTWEANINSKNIGDGSAVLHYVVFDAAGNFAEESVNVFVANNQPRIAGVSIGTDTNGNGTVDNSEMISEGYSNIYAKGKQGNRLITEAWFPSDKSSSVLKILGNTRIKPEIVGGNGQLDYSYAAYKADGSGSWLNSATVSGSGTELGTGNGNLEDPDAQTLTVDIPMAKLLNLGNTENSKLTLTISDQTPGAPLTASLNILVDSLLSDTNAPKSRLLPFYWVNGTKNSLFKESKEYGHIELPSDLPSLFTAGGTDVYDRDPKLSGIVKIEGIARDDVLLKQLKVNVGGNEYTIGTYNGSWTYTRQWDGSSIPSGTWASLVTNATYREAYDMGLISAEDFDALDEALKDSSIPYITAKYGHIVHWTLYLDTSVIGNGTDKIITASATDRGKASSTDGSTVTYSENSWTEGATTPTANVSDSGTPTGYQKVDIVPYITKISTSVRSASGLKDNNIRSASGKYSILANKAANAVTVSGFNFASGADLKARLVNTATAAGTSVTSTSGGIAVTITQNSSTSATITNTSLTKSGYLELFSNGIRALNNINNNDSYGTAKNSSGVQLTNANATATDYASAYNREADYYTTKNVQLTDDRYLLLWDMRKTNTKNGFYPVMIMDGNDPVFGYVDSTGRHSADASIAMSFPTDMQPQRRKFGSDGSYTTGNTEYLVSGTVWEQMAMAKDDDGKYHQVSVYNRTTGSMGYFYQTYAALYKTNTGYDGRQMGYGYQDYSPNVSQSGSNNALTLDGMNVGGLLVDRYQNIKLIAKGHSTTSEGATIYQAYYDDKTGELIFRDFKVATKSVTPGTVSAQNVSFVYNATVNGFLYNNSTGAGTNYSNSYVEIDGVYYTITRNRAGYAVTVNGTTRPYYYTIAGYTGTSDFTSNVYANVTYTNPDNGTWYDMYGSTCTNLNENTDDESYAQGRNSVTTNASKYYDFGVTSGKIVVFVYYDFAEGRLKLMYSSAAITGNPNTAVSFTENTSVSLPDYVGQYVSMAIDSSGGIHIAAYDANDSDLKYIYLTSYNATSYTEMTVDAAGAVGNWTSIKIDRNNKPVIAYYNATETGGRDAIKLAIANNTVGNVTAGVDSTTGYTSTGWEYMTIPSVDPAQGGSQKFQQVCLDFDSAGVPVVGYLGTNLEFGKQIGE